ncbi:MAG TPA: hypothetical protein DCQ29_08130, partial [Chitinophagaceae bacterium]|nr:hypothetical protein [Chitinophagaceae bacterium]
MYTKNFVQKVLLFNFILRKRLFNKNKCYMKKVILLLSGMFVILVTLAQGVTPQTPSMSSGTNAAVFGTEASVGVDAATFYVTWDATYLYLGWSGGRTNYSSDMYYAAIDINPNTSNGCSNSIQDVGFTSGAGVRKPDYYVVYENNSSFYGVPATSGDAFEIYNGTSGSWNFVSRTAGNDGTSSRVSFTDASGEVRLRIAWSTIGFSPGASSPLAITMWTNNASGNFMWGRMPTQNPGTGATPKTLSHSFLFYNTGSSVTPSSAAIVENNTFTTGSVSGTQSIGVSLSGSVTLSGNATFSSNVNFISGSSISIGSNTLTLSSTTTGSGTISGSSTSNLVLGGNAGTLNFTSGSRLLRNLTLNSGASATLGTLLEIAGGTTPGIVNLASLSSLTTNGNLVFKSDANGTAQLTGSGTITGNVAVERFFPSKSARKSIFLASLSSLT